MTQEFTAQSIRQAQGGSELTAPSVHPTLNMEQSIFMPDGGVHSEGIRPAKPAIRAEVTSLPRFNSALSLEGLTPAQRADALRTVKLLEKFGLKPDQVTSKGRTEQKVADVVKNAQIDSENPEVLTKSQEILGRGELTDQDRIDLFKLNASRITKAEGLLKKSLGRELTDKEKEGILRAHFEGAGEKLKNGEEAGVFNMDSRILRGKTQHLINAGFDEEQRREILESGLAAPAGAAATLLDETIDVKRSSIDPTHFTDASLNRIAQTLHGGPAIYITYERLADFGETVMSRSEFADPLEVSELRHIIRDLMGPVGIKEHKGTRELPEEAEAKFYRGQIGDIQKRINELQLMPTRTAAEDAELAAKEAQIIAEKHEQQDRLIDLVEKLPLQQGPLDLSTIDLIADYDESLYALVNRLIAHPLNLETGGYHLGFYGENNFESVSSYLEEESKKGPRDEERYRKVIVTKQAVQTFHSMNSLIVTGKINEFVSAAEQIQAEHLDIMQGTLGSGVIMRLFDQEYAMLLARDGWINNDNYGKMMGFEIESYEDPITGESRGRVVTQSEGSVFKKFERMVHEAREREANVPGSGGELARLNNWEIKWAYNIGKILHNLSLRPAEWISQGRVPDGQAKYASFPQENMARLMNWFSKMGHRFEMGKERGGDEIIKIIQEDYAKNRDEHGYAPVDISKIGGTKLSEFELPSLFWVQGSFSSWRQSLIVLRQVAIDHAISPGVTVGHVSGEESELTARNSLGELLDTARIKINGQSWKDLSDGNKAKYLQSIFLEPDPTRSGEFRLRNDISHSLGVILKNPVVTPDGDPKERKNNPELHAMREKIRIAVWKRVAEDNPLAVVRYLHGLEYKSGKKVKIFGRNGKVEELGVDWETVYEKLTRIQEMRSQSIRDRGPLVGYLNLNQYLNNLRAAGDIDVGLTVNERTLLEYIQEEGSQAAKQFANVDFNFNPFMDSIFEDFKYGNAGAEYYRRRNAGDLGSLHSAQQAGIKIISNPGGLEPKDAQKAIHEIVDNIASPHGYSLGQERGLYWANAWGRFNARGGNAGNMLSETLRQWEIVNGIFNFFQKPNSLAQKWLGPDAKAMSKKEIFDWGSLMRREGTLGAAQIKKFRKRMGGLWLKWFSVFADLAPLLGFTLSFQTIKEGFDAPEFKS